MPTSVYYRDLAVYRVRSDSKGFTNTREARAQLAWFEYSPLSPRCVRARL